jgi:arylsulfatase A-like enzyme
VNRKAILILLLILFITAFAAIFIRKLILLRERPNYRRPDYNVILISLDTLRADHISAYGYKRKTSPNIDEFADKAILFENSFCNAVWTLPSHMSLMTSLYSSTHRVWDQNTKLFRSIKTIAQILKENGYLTAAFTGGALVSKVFGFDKGFDLYRENYDVHIENPEQPFRLKHIEKDLFNWLENHPKDKFFLFVHCYDTHEPFIAHRYLKEFEQDYSGRLNFLNNHSDFIKLLDYEKYRHLIKDPLNINSFYRDVINGDHIKLTEEDKNHMVSLYDNEIKFVDHYFGRLIAKLKNLNLMTKTIIILWSDHGEELLERGDIQHGGSTYEELLRVPLIIYIPDYSGVGRNKELAQSIDIAPTILDLLNIKPENDFKGIPLLSLEFPGNQFTVCEQKGTDAIRTEKYKLMFNRKNYDVLLFDLESDPGELKNIAESHPEIVKKLKKDLFDTLNIADLNNKMIKKLKTIGYIK